VADAIRWVLGEQSYTTLRGKKTEDMIFSGSDGRARLGMASATLVLDNNDRWLPLDFSEVTISRRAYRSGENEYYLNGSRVRLRDVAELLAKGGMSRQTYTVIGQGTIDRVLSLQADERRRLFEEAAGIIFHRQKRAEALDRLEKTQGNLLRLNDIVKEIEPQMRRLEKLAERAQQYTLLKTHLDGLLRIWYGYRWSQGQVLLHEASQRLHEAETLVNQQRKQLQELNKEINRLRGEQTEVRARLSLWYAENNQLNKQHQAVQRELAVSEERAHQYEAQREEILTDLQTLAENLAAQTGQVAETEKGVEEIDRELAQANEAMSQVQEQLGLYQAQLQAVSSRQASVEQQARHLGTKLTQQQARLAQIGERRETLLAERETRTKEITGLHDQQQKLQARQADLLAQLKGVEESLSGVEKQQAREREALAGLNQVAEGFKMELSILHRQEDSLKARQDVLDKLRNDMSGYYAGVRAVLQPEARLSGIIGPMSQVIQAPPELEVALEVALGGRLQDVVVESFAAAEAAVNYLKERRLGRATFLPLDTLRFGRAVEAPRMAGVIGVASELITVEARLRPVAEFALNRTLIVKDLPTARRACATMEGGFQIVTLEGELMRSGGSVTGGRSADKRAQEGTFLAREREWRELPGQIADVMKKHEAVSSHLAENHEAANRLKKQLQNLGEQSQQLARQKQGVQTEADQAGRALEQMTANISWQESLQSKAETELAQLEARESELKQEISQLQGALQEAEANLQQLAQEVAALSAENLVAEQNSLKATLATIHSRRRNQQAILENYRTGERQLALQIKGKRQRAETLAVEREALLAQQQDLRLRGGEFEGQQAGLGEKIQSAEKTLAELEAQQMQLEHDEGQLHQRLRRHEAEQNRLSLEAARAQDELDNLQRHIHEELGLVHLEMSDEQVGQPVLPIHPLVTDLPTVKELPPGVDEDVHRLRLQVRRLGQINPDAPREYAELRERHDFLSAQIRDLEAAVIDLREIIGRLDRAMEEAFTQTFQLVAKEFQHYFKTLFGGGEAQLILTNPDDMINTGVDIVARPPGKRLQSLGLLSGGERSLTAQALIFALLRISPTPFVIFDEVDAMLDEANVGRFRDALTNLAQEIQFIVITHNRKTIEAASTLYGISMSTDSVSQVYSLKVDEWLEDKVRGG
jgi:chromosome segregation protein